VLKARFPSVKPCLGIAYIVQPILNRRPGWVYFLIQIFFILLMAASALGKLADMPGFYQVVETYRVLPKDLVPLVSWALVTTELLLALALIWKGQSQLVAAVLFFLHGMYFVWLSLALARGLQIANCGCFGVYFPRPLTGFTLIEDAFLLFLSAALWHAWCRHAVRDQL
jgi:Methylamine utilisation protein MauE